MVTRGEQLIAEAAQLPDREVASSVGQRDIDAMRDYLNSDLFAFAQFIFGFKDLIPTLHGDLSAWIKRWGQCKLTDGRWVNWDQLSSTDTVVVDCRRIMSQVSREFFKTSLGTLANALWQTCREPFYPVAIFNEKQKRSEKWLKAIRDVAMSNRTFQQLYKDILPPSIHYSDTRSMPRWWKWSDSELDFGGKRTGEVEPSLSAHGIEGAAVGGHWPKLIFDDLISLDHQRSQLEMERAREWIKVHTYLMRPSERSLVYVNCTPWTYNDIYRDLLTDFGYRLYRRAALEYNGLPDVARGESIFPQKLSTQKLRAMHKRDPFTFSAQMQCIPMAGRDQSFQASQIKYGTIDVGPDGEPVFVIDEHHYDPTIGAIQGDTSPPRVVPLHLLQKDIFLDPAPTEQSQQRQDPHARNGILVVGLDCWGRKYLLESWADRAPYSDIIDRLFQFSIKWNCDRVHCEEVNFSNVYRHWIQRETERDGRYPGHNLVCLPLYPKGREKHARIRSTEPEWKDGLYYVNQPECGQFLVELTEYPNSQTVDLLDCMGYIKETMQRPLNSTELTNLRRVQAHGAPWTTPYYDGLESY